MTKIIRQLLDFARPRPPKKARTDVLALARAIEALLRPMARKRKVEVAIDPGTGPAEVEVDAGQIQQVLTNLTVNAIHAMPNGGTARISARNVTARSPADRGGKEGGFLRIDIEDQGVGISDESKVHLFEPFFTTKGVGEGTGLGLSVSLGIVREHGGWIDVESSVGKGSKFSVYLPV
jgi:signal transduction histidine kinase